MQGLTLLGSVRRFLASHATIYNTLNLQRHIIFPIKASPVSGRLFYPDRYRTVFQQIGKHENAHVVTLQAAPWLCGQAKAAVRLLRAGAVPGRVLDVQHVCGGLTEL